MLFSYCVTLNCIANYNFCMHSCNWQLLFTLLLLTILYASLQLTMFVCIIFLLHFLMFHWKWHFWYADLLNYWSCQPLNGYNKMFLWTILNDILCMHASLLQFTTFCMHCCTNFLIHYCNGNSWYIDNFYIAKLSPSPNPSSIGLLYFHLILSPTHRPDQPPTRPEKFLRHN